jgi:hypothetical protein
VTLDHARGAGILITIEPAAKVPSAEDYLKETEAFLAKEKARYTITEQPHRLRKEPVILDRFGIDAEFGKDKARLEYAILKQTDGGVTVAARIPATEVITLKVEVERIIRSLAVTKKIVDQ